MGNLYNLIQSSQGGDQKSTLMIIEKFYPLIRKYSKKLDYDGADSDLTICLLETICNMPIKNNPDMKRDACIVGYINVSIKNKYIYFSKKYTQIKMETELNPNIAGETFYETIEDHVYVSWAFENLSKMQKKVLRELFIENKSVSQIANQLNISRQAVNKTKNRALKNLRDKNIM